MGASKQLHHDYTEIQESYLTDIDCSGGLYLEMQERNKQELKVIVSNFGKFYKATLNGGKITKEELFNLLNITDKTPLRLEHHVYNFEKANKRKFKVEIQEINVE